MTQILTIDIGTGTQDIFLFDSRLDIENGFKMVVPSPTMQVRRRLQEATRHGDSILLSGVTMGGGPCGWAAEDHARKGLPIYATPDAARTINDDLDAVQASGITLLSEDEAAHLPASVVRLHLRDFDFTAIAAALDQFDVSLATLDAVAIAVFDHGAAPKGISDRQFRFDYIDERIRKENRLSAFAFRSDDIPPIMTRMQAVAATAKDLDAPLIVMDTAPAAVLGAGFDRMVASCERYLAVNIGNLHTLAFRLGEHGIEGVFEHHTGLIDLPKLESLLRSLAEGSLSRAEVFNDHGHGALISNNEPLTLGVGEFDVAVTGPRRSLFQPAKENPKPTLRPYLAVPFGDMMIAGCFGLLAATADLLPELREPIHAALKGEGRHDVAPWD
ncbi:MAG: DUF1786 domain-containing protein [Anaerolineales bacterium]|nr:DUF1786 domain-containing protein [Anaerolineales bacterium]